MRSARQLLALAGTAAVLAGCSHFNQNTDNVSYGDVSIDSLSATRTGILRVQNNYGDTVRVYTVLKGAGSPNYVAKSMPGAVRTWVLDPKLFPVSDLSIELRPASGPRRTLGPYRVLKGQTIDIVLPADLANASATIHSSVP